VTTNCTAIQEELEALHYGDLDGAERQAVEAHLASCPACRAALEAVRETAASLDTIPVPEPGELAWARFDRHLDARIAPMRAQRMARSYGFLGRARLVPVAAAVLIAGLSVLSAAFYRQIQGQNAQIGMLQKEVAERAWQEGDTAAYQRTVLAASAEQSDPLAEQRLEAIRQLPDLEMPRLWARARNSTSEEEQRDRIAEFVQAYPKEPLAKVATNKLLERGRVKLPPLERALLKPVPFIAPVPGETHEQTCHRTIARLRESAVAPSQTPKSARVLFEQAARIAAEELKDDALAAKLRAEAASLPNQ
jgi:hypothetical protein